MGEAPATTPDPVYENYLSSLAEKRRAALASMAARSGGAEHKAAHANDDVARGGGDGVNDDDYENEVRKEKEGMGVGRFGSDDAALGFANPLDRLRTSAGVLGGLTAAAGSGKGNGSSDLVAAAAADDQDDPQSPAEPTFSNPFGLPMVGGDDHEDDHDAPAFAMGGAFGLPLASTELLPDTDGGDGGSGGGGGAMFALPMVSDQPAGEEATLEDGEMEDGEISDDGFEFTAPDPSTETGADGENADGEDSDDGEADEEEMFNPANHMARQAQPPTQLKRKRVVYDDLDSTATFGASAAQKRNKKKKKKKNKLPRPQQLQQQLGGGHSQDDMVKLQNAGIPAAMQTDKVPSELPLLKGGDAKEYAEAGFKEREQEFEKTASRTPCQYWAQGHCKQGTACQYSHAAETVAARPCRFFKSNSCHRGANCIWSHDLQAEPCIFHHLKQHIGGCRKGDACPFSHDPMTEKQLDTLRVEQKRYDDRIKALTAEKASRSGSSSSSEEDDSDAGDDDRVKAEQPLTSGLSSLTFPDVGKHCVFYHLKQASGGCWKGAGCKFSHDPISKDERDRLAAMQTQHEQKIHGSSHSSFMGAPPAESQPKSFASGAPAHGGPGGQPHHAGPPIGPQQRFQNQPRSFQQPPGEQRNTGAQPYNRQPHQQHPDKVSGSPAGRSPNPPSQQQQQQRFPNLQAQQPNHAQQPDFSQQLQNMQGAQFPMQQSLLPQMDPSLLQAASALLTAFANPMQMQMQMGMQMPMGLGVPGLGGMPQLPTDAGSVPPAGQTAATPVDPRLGGAAPVAEATIPSSSAPAQQQGGLNPADYASLLQSMPGAASLFESVFAPQQQLFPGLANPGLDLTALVPVVQQQMLLQTQQMQHQQQQQQQQQQQRQQQQGQQIPQREPYQQNHHNHPHQPHAHGPNQRYPGQDGRDGGNSPGHGRGGFHGRPEQFHPHQQRNTHPTFRGGGPPRGGPPPRPHAFDARRPGGAWMPPPPQQQYQQPRPARGGSVSGRGQSR